MIQMEAQHSHNFQTRQQQLQPKDFAIEPSRSSYKKGKMMNQHLSLFSLLLLLCSAEPVFGSITSHIRSGFKSYSTIEQVMEPIQLVEPDSFSSTNETSTNVFYSQRERISRQMQATPSGLNSTTFVTQVNKTHVFPSFTLDPDCASGHDMNVAVSTLNIEGIDKDGKAVFSNTLRWLFYNLNLKDYGMIISPRIVYDKALKQFIVAATVTDKKAFSNIVIAVSKDSTPLSGTAEDWDVRMIDTWDFVTGVGNVWSDEIGLAVDSDAVYVTGTMWTNTSIHDPQSFVHSRLWTFDRVGLNGLKTSAGANPSIPLVKSANGIYRSETVLGMTMTGSTEYIGPYYPATIENAGSKKSSTFGTYLVAYNTGVSGVEEELHIIRISNPVSPNPVLTEHSVNLGDIDDLMSPLPPVEQPGSGSYGSDYSGIETGDRKVQDVAWYDESLYVVLTVTDVAGQTAVYWGNITAASSSQVPTLTVTSSGIMDAENISLDASAFFPSIAVNMAGDVIVGFGASGPETYAGMYAQLTTSSFPHELKAGETDTESIDGLSYFGATSGISVDPMDDDCFWAFNQYARETTLPLELHQWERGALATSWAKVCISV